MYVTVIICAGLVIAVSLGTRHGFGLFLPWIGAAHGWGRETFSFALAVQNLVWGFSQPLFGMLADRFGFARVVTAGAVSYAAGLALMPWSRTALEITASAGILIGLGLGATTWIGFGAVSRRVPAERESTALGIASGFGGIGQLVLLPATHVLIGAWGWQYALLVLALTASSMALAARGLVVPSGPEVARPAASGMKAALREALTHRGFWLLNLGFVVCGFQLAFITNHLPAYLADHGIDHKVGVTALAIIVAANSVGSFLCGYLGSRYRRKYLLSGLYLTRTLATVLYVSLPLTTASTLMYAFVMGLTWLGTVPLTSGVLSQIFGVRYLATLFGFVFLGHQLGGFAGVWLAGFVFDATGSYQVVWATCIGLGALSTFIHPPIDDRAMARTPVAEAARA